MTKRKKKSPSSATVVWLLVLGLAGLGGVAAYVQYGGAKAVPPELRGSTAAAHRTGKPSHSDPQVVVPSMKDEKLTFQNHQEVVPEGMDPMVFVINKYLTDSKVVPATARALKVELKDGVALIDFTPAFDQTYGSDDERILLTGLRTTMGQFPNVEKIQFFVDGKPVETLGNVELSDPLPVIRPGQASPDAKPNEPQQ